MVEIPIVMTTDNNYVIQTSVTILTILENKGNKTEFIFYILNDGKLTAESKQIIETIACTNSSRVYFLTVDISLFADAATMGHIPVSSYYRLLISEMLPGFDKCIFIDGDTLVKIDIAELFLIDLKDNYVAGIKDCGIQYRLSEYMSYNEKLGIPDMKDYVNAGVLVLNLYQIRKDKMIDVFISQMRKGYLMMDQDVINASCYGKIKLLPLEYNVFSEFTNNQDKLRDTFFSKQEIECAKQKTKIIHFAGKYKPWNNIRFYYGQAWWEYAKKVLGEEQYNYLYAKAIYESELRDWSYLISSCYNSNNIIIFGYSKIGKSLYNRLKLNGINTISAFCDNNAKKQGECYDGITVNSLNDILKNFNHPFFVISSQRYYEEIKKQLISMGVMEEQLIRYFIKDKAYYYYLSEEYYEKEIEEWMLHQYGTKDIADKESLIKEMKYGEIESF